MIVQNSTTDVKPQRGDLATTSAENPHSGFSFKLNALNAPVRGQFSITREFGANAPHGSPANSQRIRIIAIV